MHMSILDVESVERATIAAVSPEEVLELDGWLLAFDSGTIGRAKSAAPLAHVAADVGVIEQIEAEYATRGLPAVFRLATDTCFDALRVQLQQRGYVAAKPTWAQTASVQAMRQVTNQPIADVDSTPDAAWTALFLGEGFDPVDGASRVNSLSRSTRNVYASVREAGQTVAGGAASFSHGWASVHGMRTAAGYRGQGLAGRVLAGLAKAAVDRVYDQVFLQVEANNPAAQALYKRAGFTTAWTYEYWTKNSIKRC